MFARRCVLKIITVAPYSEIFVTDLLCPHFTQDQQKACCHLFVRQYWLIIHTDSDIFIYTVVGLCTEYVDFVSPFVIWSASCTHLSLLTFWTSRKTIHIIIITSEQGPKVKMTRASCMTHRPTVTKQSLYCTIYIVWGDGDGLPRVELYSFIYIQFTWLRLKLYPLIGTKVSNNVVTQPNSCNFFSQSWTVFQLLLCNCHYTVLFITLYF